MIINLKESNHLLAEVLYAEGVDMYKLDKVKRNPELLKKLKQTRQELDRILKIDFNTSFVEFDTLTTKEQKKIRKSILSFLQESDEEIELKKQIPLGQIIPYIETLVSHHSRALHKQIKEDLDGIPDTYLCLKIITILKQLSKKSEKDEILKKINSEITKSGVQSISKSKLSTWLELLQHLVHPIESQYKGHLEFMNFNEDIRDLSLRSGKKNILLTQIFDTKKLSWEPQHLDHDINEQSAEVNRSIIEVISNALDSGTKTVDLDINKSGYVVQDYGQGMSPSLILEKLLLPKVTGKEEGGTIGRFGVGFYTVLSHLKTSDDMVRVTTNNGENIYVIEFSFHQETGDVFYHSHKLDELNIPKGTKVEVKTNSFDSKNAIKLGKQYLAFAHGADINYQNNGEIETLNQRESFETIKGKDVEIAFIPKISQQCNFSVCLNGILIENFTYSGAAIPTEVMLDFPLKCTLSESRSELTINKIALSGIKSVLQTMVDTNIDDELKASIFNVLYELLKVFQSRAKNNGHRVDLSSDCSKAFKEAIKIENYNILPNTLGFECLDVKEALWVNDSLVSSQLSNIDAIKICENWSGNSRLYLVDFKQKTENFYFEDGNGNIFMSREMYEKFKNSPCLLNLFFTNIDSSGQNKIEKYKGSFTTTIDDSPLSKKSITEKKITKLPTSFKLPEIEIIPEEVSEELRLIHKFYLPDYSLSEITQWVDFPESKKLTILKQQVVAQIPTFKKEFNQVQKDRVEKVGEPFGSFYGRLIKNPWQEDLELIIEEIHRVLEEEPIDTWLDTFWKFTPNAYMLIKETYFFLELSTRKAQIEGEIKGLRIAKSLEDQKIQNRFTGEIKSINHISFLTKSLQECFDIDALWKRVEAMLPGDKETQLKFIDFSYNIYNKYYMKPEISKKLLIRGVEFFLQRLWNLPSEEWEDFYSKFMRQLIMYDKNNLPDYVKLNPIVREALFYVFEGTDLLESDSGKTLELDKYESKFDLATLVAVKKQNQNFFKSFLSSSSEIEDFIKKTAGGLDISVAAREVRHSSQSQIANGQYLWLREMLSNSHDALVDSGKSGEKVKVDCFLQGYSDNKQLIIEVSDPVGMDMDKVINYLLTPNASDKRDNANLIGEKGQGFFTIFQNAVSVLIKTCATAGVVNYFKIKPIRDENDSIYRYEVKVHQENENFSEKQETGTIIQQVVENDLPELDAALCKSSLMTYGALSDAEIMPLFFKNIQINKPQSVIISRDIKDLGPIKLFHSKTPAVTQNGFYVKDLDEDYISAVPEKIRQEILSYGILLDLPPAISLIKSRTDIAHKQDILPNIQSAVSTMAFELYIQLIQSGRLKIKNIPYDYFERSHDIKQEIQTDATLVSIGGILDSSRLNFYKSEDRLSQLVSLLPAFQCDGKTLSLAELKKKYDNKELTNENIFSLNKEIQDLITYADQKKNAKDFAILLAKKTFNSESPYIKSSFSLPNNTKIKEQADVYYAFDYLFSEVLKLIDTPKTERQYSLTTGIYKARAGLGGIDFNLYQSSGMGFWKTMSELIDEQKPFSNKAVQDFLQSIIRLITHEQRHNEEDTYNLKHNDLFFKEQRKIITRILNKEGDSLQQIWESCLSDFSGTYIPEIEMIKLL